MLFGQLICFGCHRILTYPLGAITCRCRLCNVVNAAQNIEILCETCGQQLHAPINTLALLCPCCGTVTDVPEELLPPMPSCVDLGEGENEQETVIYVSHPTLPPRPRRTTATDENGGGSPSSSRPRTLGASPKGRLTREELESSAVAGFTRSGGAGEGDGQNNGGGAGSAPLVPREAMCFVDHADAKDAGEKKATPSPPSTQAVSNSRLAPTVVIATQIL